MSRTRTKPSLVSSWCVLVTASVAMGCSNASPTRELLEQQNDVARLECNCFYADDGYDSASECRRDSTFPIITQATNCGDRALRADGTGEMLESVRCTIDAGALRLDCQRAADCDEVAIRACDLEYATAVAGCPQPSAEAQSAYQGALQACIFGTDDGPRVNGCPDEDLGSSTGPAVASGTTTRADNDLGGSCGGQRANDVAYSWVAPQSGTVTIDTVGSDLDTILYVLEGTCSESVELACNDDGGTGFQSEVAVDVTAGDALIIVVDGWASDEGDFVLNIDYVPAP